MPAGPASSLVIKNTRHKEVMNRERATLVNRLALEGVECPRNIHYNTYLMAKWSDKFYEDEWEYLRYTCRDNFWQFFLHAWGVLYGPYAEDWLSKRDPIAETMANWFQEQVEAWEESRRNKEDKQRWIMVMVAREFGKTTLFTQAGLLWIHLRNPNVATYIGSDVVDSAVDILKAIKPVLDGTDKYALFSKLYGNWYNSDLTWTREEVIHKARTLSTKKEPSFKAWGIDTSITGKHPDVVCVDDPNNYPAMERDSKHLENVTRHCASLSPVLLADGLKMYVGTPYGAMDNLCQSLKRDGVASLTGLPMADYALREDGRWHVLHIPGRDAEDKPLVPRVWSEERMAQFKLENDAHYAAQILLRPEVAEDVPLTREQVEDCQIDEKDVQFNFLRYTMHLDTAWKDANSARRGDESVIQIWGHTRDGSGDVIFIEGYSSNIWRGEQFYEQLVLLLQKYKRLNRKITLITDEMSPGKKGANQLMLSSFCNGKGIAAPPLLEISRAGKNKHKARIRPAATYWQDGHVRIVRGAPGAHKLMEQMSRLTPEMAYDDWADAAADVFNPIVYQAMKRIQKPGQVEDWSNPTDPLLKPRERLPRYEDDDSNVFYPPI